MSERENHAHPEHHVVHEPLHTPTHPDDLRSHPVPPAHHAPDLMTNTLLTPLSVLIGSLIIAGSVLYSSNRTADLVASNARANNGTAQAQPQQPNQPAQPDPNERVNVSADDDAFIGRADAKVTIVEFSDYQCPFCKRFEDQTYGQIKKEYIDTGKVKLVFRDLPLAQLHPDAPKAAEATECAKDQGKFWEMHDALFKVSPTLDVASLKSAAKTIGLNTTTFDACLDGGQKTAEVAKDQQEAESLGVTGTPTFFVNGKRLVGAQPFAAFKQVIDAELGA